jgi:NTE family protein
MIGSRAWLLCVIALLAWAGAQPSSAQDSAQPARPRIGLALGGGSARGFTHIGVLEWLEEHRIPVDYVVGTSMGGLMRGIYATGMPPREIRALVNSTNWDEFLLTEAPYTLKGFRRKQDQRSYLARLELGLKHGVKLQGGLDPILADGGLLNNVPADVARAMGADMQLF